MESTKNFKQLVRHTCWLICKQFLISILVLYLLPLTLISITDITERNIQTFSIFFNTFSSIYLSIIVITIIAINITKLLKTIKIDMDLVYEQSTWFIERPSVIRDTQLTLIEFIETKYHIEKMQKKIKTMLEEEKKQKQDLMFQVSAAAHDLKTPLTVIRGNAEFLQTIDTNEQEKQCLSDIENASKKLDDYFDQLINYSKTFYDHAEVYQTYSAKELTEILDQELRYTIRKKGIFTLDSNVNENIKVRIDMNLLIRAILNLVANALSYSEDEKPTIRLIIRSTKKSVVISLWNSGSKFSREIMCNVGQLFYREDKARSLESNHYGIGLAFVQRVAQLHKGNIKLTNCSNGANVDFYVLRQT